MCSDCLTLYFSFFVRRLLLSVHISLRGTVHLLLFCDRANALCLCSKMAATECYFILLFCLHYFAYTYIFLFYFPFHFIIMFFIVP